MAGSSSGAASSADNGGGAAAAAKAVSGMGAGVLSTILCSPLDVAKTRVQVQTTVACDAKYHGVMSALRTIYVEEGLAGWFRGLAPAVSSVAVFWSIYFPCYDATKEKVVATTGLPMTSALVHCSAGAAVYYLWSACPPMGVKQLDHLQSFI